MKIEHIGIWVNDLERMRAFYQNYFHMQCGKKYENPEKGFSSYFLSFENGAHIEIMTKKDLSGTTEKSRLVTGLAHIAISVGIKEAVDSLTEQLRRDGFEIIGEPRTTGDGYYESVISDPEGNLVEITE